MTANMWRCGVAAIALSCVPTDVPEPELGRPAPQRPEPWQPGAAEPTEAPLLTAIESSSNLLCTVDTRSVVDCTSIDEFVAPPPGVSMTQILVSDEGGCGLRTQDFEVECWGSAPYAGGPIPRGPFVDIALGNEVACALPAEGDTPRCWGRNGAVNMLDGTYVHIAGGRHICGIDDTDIVRCSGMATEWSNILEIHDSPFGPVAIDRDGNVFDLAREGDAVLSVPPGPYEAFAYAGAHTCGVRGGALLCLDGAAPTQLSEALDVAVTDIGACAIDGAGALTCWP